MFFIFFILHAIISFIYLLYYKLNVSHKKKFFLPWRVQGVQKGDSGG